ncbi:excalibur calcium-binding domain-containing protein [Nonomuraea lactucae]|uniref:excalibur calcium-binding domain-containing protein n=1 Tax=Nonomuraea lactucae TaxID=2249762 RepID=UPI0019625A24|nr:excalibur calcium-binding domain-containing protein [Nonomuraea lactucae]
MDKPAEEPPAAPGKARASRLTTLVLIVSLVLVVVVAGVLGTIAVLMTRSPDSPLLGGVPPQRLPTPIHFAPVRESKAAPCPGAEAVLDEPQTTCYLLEDGVTVNAVQRIEAVREKNGTYSVRIAIAPAFKDKVVQLIDELVADQRQVAVVLVPKTVIAAPVVTQAMDGDSLSIAGFTRHEAEALVVRLLGSAPATGQPSPGASDPNAPTTGDPGTGVPGTGNPGTGNPGTGVPGTGNPGTAPPGTGTQDPGLSGTGAPTTGPATGPASTGPASTGPVSTGTAPATIRGRRVPDPQFASCKEAAAAGYGPYYKGSRPEYDWYTDVDKNGVACNSADIR